MTLTELTELTVAWLQHRRPTLPYYDRGPEPETATITDQLIALNHAGVTTTCSQPGIPDRQRGYLTAITDRTLGTALYEKANEAGLIAFAYPLDTYDPTTSHITGTWSIPITIHRGPTVDDPDTGRTVHPGDHITWAADGPDEIVIERCELNPAEYRDTVRLTFVDPHWGRPTHLVDTLLRLIGTLDRAPVSAASAAE